MDSCSVEPFLYNAIFLLRASNSMSYILSSYTCLFMISFAYCLLVSLRRKSASNAIFDNSELISIPSISGFIESEVGKVLFLIISS